MLLEDRSHALVTAALLLFLLCLPSVCAAKVYVVAVGISDYPGTRNDLLLPAEDAKTVKWLYEKNSASGSVLLVNSQATAQNIIDAMLSLFANAGANDIVVLFFSGHGVKGSFCAYDSFLSYTRIIKAMSKSKSRNKIIFADACFAGKMRGTGGGADDETTVKDARVMLFLSSRSNEKSMERKSMSNGLFTTYLVRGLRGRADINRDRIITARELYEYVRKRVAEVSGDRQHPVMWGRFPDTMPVMVW